MTWKRMRWTAALGVVMGLPCVGPAAEDVVWRAVREPGPAGHAVPASPSPAPAARLGRPVPVPGAPPADAALTPARYSLSSPGGAVVRAQSEEPLPPVTPPPFPPPVVTPLPSFPPPGADAASGIRWPGEPGGPPAEAAPPGRESHVALGPPDSVPPPESPAPAPAVPPPVVTTPPPSPPLATPPPAAPFPTGPGGADAPVDAPLNGPGWWGRFVGTWEWGERPPGGGWILTDCNFEGLISPVSNPFFFEDPRALTEVRPIFMYQKAPDNNPVFQGGHSEFFGLQARIAFTNRLSLVLNKFGWVALHPENPVPGVEDDTGFSEVYLGPKYTFLRRPESGFIGAAGLTFEIPLGSSRVSQDTGNLGLDPYVTLGKNFRVGGGFGSFNLLGEAGYNFSLENKRSEFFHSSLHLDYNVANTNRFFPLVELNWFHYANPGKARVLGFEGADLVNFGSNIEGDRDYVTLAGGLRYKFSEHLQLGGAIEFPLTQQKLITDYRLTFDLILRY